MKIQVRLKSIFFVVVVVGHQCWWLFSQMTECKRLPIFDIIPNKWTLKTDHAEFK